MNTWKPYPTRFPGRTAVQRLRSFGWAGLTMAKLTAPGIKNPHTLNHLLATTRRDIYAETVDAMGYDPLARK